MFISQQLRKTNIAEYILYMWQIEDIIRAYGCDLTLIRKDYISRFDLTEEQREEMIDWYGNTHDTRGGIDAWGTYTNKQTGGTADGGTSCTTHAVTQISFL